MRTLPLLLATLTLLPALLAAPAAAGAAAGCPASYVTLDATPAGRGVLYLGDDGSLWQETNRVQGLQCAPFLVGGRLVPPDTRLVA